MSDTSPQFSVPMKVMFRHCDPAGIVFYPRYFEMVNDAVETLFRDKFSWPFEELHKTHGCPTVAIEASFVAVSRHGDELNLQVNIGNLGRSSMRLHLTAICNSEIRFSTTTTLVCTSKSGKSAPCPNAVRTHIEYLLGESP